MLFTVYERACVMADLKKVDLKEMNRELQLPSIDTPVVKRAIITYLTKISLIKDRQIALDNLVVSIGKFTSSNESLITEASDVSAKAIGARINLEISVLESQLKMMEIESATIDTMTSEAFTAKYGA
jgi:hypothetical protein